MTPAFSGHPKRRALEADAVRADRFVRHCEAARVRAIQYGDFKFFAKLAYQGAFVSQMRYIEGCRAEQAIRSLRIAVEDFATALDLGYPTEAAEVNNWFYRAMVVHDHSQAQFLAALPERVWPHGDPFLRAQACWGFVLFRGRDELASEILEFLHGLSIEVDEPPDEAAKRLLQLKKNLYSIMEAILKKDSPSAASHLHQRTQWRPLVPPEGTRYERFQPLDLLGLGLCRLARLRGMTVKIDDPSLPLSLLDATS